MNKTLSVSSIVYKYLQNPKYMECGAGKMAKLWGTTPENIRQARAKARNLLHKDTSVVSRVEDLKNKVAKYEGTFNEEPKSSEDIVALFKIDTSKYALTKYWTKFQGNSWTVTAEVTMLKDKLPTPEEILNVLKSYSPHKITYTRKEKSEVNRRKTCAFFDLTDFHLDKKDIFNTPIEQKVEEYSILLDSLLFKAKASNYLDEIVFVIGSDMLHTDNIFNQTTKGTQQEVNISWDEAFITAFDIYVNSIIKLAKCCNKLNVILVSSNHSRTKEFYLAYALKRYFEYDTSIVFDISTAQRKVYIYGNTFIGLHHGNTKIDMLPLVFAKEFTSSWGVCKYHEIKVGDKHHYMEKDYGGVRIKQLPACTNPDNWHNDNLFVNSVQSAVVSIYDFEKGRCMDIEERL